MQIAHIEARAPRLNVLLPVGISFYTFQALGYSIDVWRGKIKAERSLLSYALFVTFFPQLVAGPIERTEHLLPQLKRLPKFDYDKAVSGLRLCLCGMVKKVIIADTLAQFVEKAYGNVDAAPGITMFVATVFFAFQVLCDFSGYSDIAVGVSRVLGYDLMQNFDRPYLSHSVGEFWRRWHISLSSWLRDYVYIPLGGSRKGRLCTYINLMITFLVSGLWHGAAGHFVLWGAVHGALLVAERMMRDARETNHVCRVPIIRLPSDFCRYLRCRFRQKLYRGNPCGGGIEAKRTVSWCTTLHIAVTFVLVVIAWVFFRSDNVSLAVSALRKMMQIPQDVINIIRAMAGGKAAFGEGFWWQYTLETGRSCIKYFLCAGAIIISDVMAGNRAWCRRATAILSVRAVRWTVYYAALVILWLFVMPQEEPSQFIYFQF